MDRLLLHHNEPQEREVEKATLRLNKLVLLRKPFKIITFLLTSKLTPPLLKKFRR